MAISPLQRWHALPFPPNSSRVLGCGCLCVLVTLVAAVPQPQASFLLLVSQQKKDLDVPPILKGTASAFPLLLFSVLQMWSQKNRQ